MFSKLGPNLFVILCRFLIVGGLLVGFKSVSGFSVLESSDIDNVMFPLKYPVPLCCVRFSQEVFYNKAHSVCPGMGVL